MRIGELVRRTAVSRDTIRFYEKNGLINSQPTGSPTNNYRDYPETTVLTLDLISQAKSAGFTLAELIVFTSQLDAAESEDFDGMEFLQGKIDEVEARIEQSKKFLKTLKATKRALAVASLG